MSYSYTHILCHRHTIIWCIQLHPYWRSVQVDGTDSENVFKLVGWLIKDETDSPSAGIFTSLGVVFNQEQFQTEGVAEVSNKELRVMDIVVSVVEFLNRDCIWVVEVDKFRGRDHHVSAQIVGKVGLCVRNILNATITKSVGVLPMINAVDWALVWFCDVLVRFKCYLFISVCHPSLCLPTVRVKRILLDTPLVTE